MCFNLPDTFLELVKNVSTNDKGNINKYQLPISTKTTLDLNNYQLPISTKQFDINTSSTSIPTKEVDINKSSTSIPTTQFDLYKTNISTVTNKMKYNYCDKFNKSKVVYNDKLIDRLKTTRTVRVTAKY